MPAGLSQQPSRRIDAVDTRHLAAVERQIQAGPDPDFQHTTTGLRHDPPPVFDELAVGRGEMGEAWQYMITIQRHDVDPGACTIRYLVHPSRSGGGYATLRR